MMSKPAPAVMLVIALVVVVLVAWLTPATWSPYVAGAVIGVLSWLTFLISDEALGTSTTLVRLSGFIARLLSRKAVDDNEYYRETGVKVDWQMMLVTGLLLGSLISALLSGSFEWRWLPAGWQVAFGSALPPRLIIAFLGGMLIGFGARWAGGCTSGHGISQALQLSVAGWVSGVFFFIGGIILAMMMYGPGGMR